MLELILMRHAKSSWDDASLSDHQRPLNARGQRAAPIMAKRLAEAHHIPQRIVCSDAQRAQQTAQLMYHVWDQDWNTRVPVDSLSALYTFDDTQLEQVLGEFVYSEQRLLVVGHNPAIEQLLDRWFPDQATSMPTAALAVVHFFANNWQERQGLQENIAADKTLAALAWPKRQDGALLPVESNG